MRLVECVPNFSEGRRPEVVRAIRDAIAAAPGVLLLDASADASHNRSVVTFAAPPDRVLAGALAGIRTALDLIDIREHTGVHPWIGACDVVPFVPLGETTMDECIALARELAERVAAELEIPVYLYERAALRAERADLAAVRRGGLEALRRSIAADPARRPDCGPARLHPTFGAIAIGARPLLVAFNVYLGGAVHVTAAREIAREVRASSGGLPAVKALGLEVDGQAQVSMNLVDIERTPLHVAVSAVRDAARRRGLDITWSELIGLLPERAMADAAGYALALRDCSVERTLEHRLRAALNAADADVPVGDEALLRRLSAATPAPAGASAGAYAGAMAGALGVMAAGIAARKSSDPALDALAARAAACRDALAELVSEDAEAVRAMIAASRRRADSGSAASGAEGARAVAPTSEPDVLPPGRSAAFSRQAALEQATLVPLRIARRAADAAAIAGELVRLGHPATRTDALAGVLLGEAACRIACATVAANAALLPSGEHRAAWLAEAAELRDRTGALRSTALQEVERG